MAYGERVTERITLTDPNYWVEIYTNQTYGQVKELEHLQEIKGVSSADLILRSMIVDWNLDGSDGVKLPVEAESFNQLLAADASLILDAINKQFEAQQDSKKNSSAK